MITWASVPVYLHRDPVDFRKAINGLSVIVEQGMDLSPFEEALFVFCNKRRDKLKVLYWDKSGFCLWHKRLEQAKFHWPREGDDVLSLDTEQFNWLLRGYNLSQLQGHATVSFGQVSGR